MPSAAAAQRPLLRPRRDRVLLGVASGFARHAGLDVSLVRVGLVVAAVWSMGLGVVFYLAVAAFLPCDRPAR